MTFLRALGVSVILAGVAACTSTSGDAAQTAPAATTTPAVASTPSPRAECAPAHVTLYFAEQVSSDEPVVTPLLNDFMARVHACEGAGGELRSISIVTVADPGQNARDGRAQVERRVARVRTALVNAGAPADKIREGAATQADAVMGRRAEITADLY